MSSEVHAFARPIRVAYVVSHPIQYQAPLLRRLSKEPWIDLKVFFGSDFSVRGYRDKGFNVDVEWDVPLLDGYEYDFLPSWISRERSEYFSDIKYGIWSRFRDSRGHPAFDILWVHGYSSPMSLQVMLVAKFLGIPVLLRAEPWLADRPRGAIKLLLKKMMMQAVKRLVKAVLPIGTLNAQYWEHYFGHDFPSFLVPYAVDNQYFQIAAQKARTGREALQVSLKIEPGHPVILFASKLQARKHCEDLIEAYNILIQEGRPGPTPYLLIVGDGAERGSLEARVALMELRTVIFAGFQNQSELPRYFDLASVFVLPAKHEPWGLIVNEVMNASLPVIVSDEVGCHRDLVRHGIEGYVYPARNVRALADVLALALQSKPHFEELGHNAFKTISAWDFEQDVAGLRSAVLSTVSANRLGSSTPVSIT